MSIQYSDGTQVNEESMDCLVENVHYMVKYKTGLQPKTANRDKSTCKWIKD